jgi:hypothetical protein
MTTPYPLPPDADKVPEFQWREKYDFPRDLVGYGEQSFNPQWPGGAKIAVSFVINYEEVCSVMRIKIYLANMNRALSILF